ncbi:MAG: Multidrug resistance protein MdtH [Myxococcota bacterium]|nr:Multidrug resistance protein MdtH [Myxococcota bacterium]
MNVNVLALGVVSLLTDVSSEMIVPFLPVFLSAQLGGGAAALGWIEGAADFTASVLKLVSGKLADRLGRNRPFVIAGYTISSLARPLVAAAGAAWHVVVIRVLDRTGKGLRTSPRDALIAASVSDEERGVAYGFHRAMDHAGAVLGPLAALSILTWLTSDLRTLFWIAAIPGMLSIIVLALFVRDVDPGPEAQPPKPAQQTKSRLLDGPPRAMWPFLIPLSLFTLGEASDLFLLMKASELQAGVSTLPMYWMGFHVGKSVFSILGGRLADRFGEHRTVAAGWIIACLSYAGFGLVESKAGVAILFAFYSLYYGLTEGPEKALISKLVPADQRGAAFGWYHITIGILGFPASVLFGYLWQHYGSVTAYLTGACLSASGLLVWLIRPVRPPPRAHG